MAVPYTFGSATSAIPLSQLDSNFATTITLGNTAIQLGNTVTILNNMTFANVTISSGSVTITDVTASGNVTISGGTANGVAYLNASKILTTGTGLVFDGTNLGVGTSSPSAKLDVSYGDYQVAGAIRIGADLGTNTTRTTNTRKFGAITSVPYDNAKNNICAFSVDSQSNTVTNLNIGGGSSSFNSPSTIAFYTSAAGITAGTQAMTLDASGNLGIGVTSPNGKLSVAGNITLEPGGSGPVASSRPQLWRGADGFLGIQSGGDTGGVIAFHTSSSGTPSERARIDTSGNLLVGKQANGSGNIGAELIPSGQIGSTMSASTNSTITNYVYSTGAAAFRFYVGLGGTVYATSTTITAISSDERLKQDIVDYDKGLAEVLALRPRSFAYKTEPDRKLSGFISQEVQTVMPEAIEPTLEDPEMLTYAIDWHPLLVKAIQEQQAIIQTLTDRITALEAK